MDKSTLKALNDSIAHWKRHASGTAGKKEGIYSNDCALCQKFLKGKLPQDQCKGCPIALKTGQDQCRGTPWREAEGAYKTPHFPKAAEVMVQFLESLLPPEPPQIQRKLSESTLQKFRLKNGEFSAAKAKRALKKEGYNVLSARVRNDGNLEIKIKV